MVTQAQIFTPEEIMRRGKTIYEERLRAQVEASENVGKFISINVLSGDFEVGANHLETSDRLFERQPDAVVSTLRIGFPATFSRGVRMRPVAR